MKNSLLLVCFVTIVSITGWSQTIKVKMRKGVDLTTYETFTVMKGEVMMPPDQRKINEGTLFESVKQSIQKEMEMRGYHYVADSSAQLYVGYVAGAYDLTQGGTLGPLSQSPASSPSEMNQSRSWSHDSREGMMVIDMSDSRTKTEVWSASGNLTLDGVDLNRALDAMIYKAFKKFPNRNKKKKK